MSSDPKDEKDKPATENLPEENPDGLSQATNGPDAESPDKERVEEGEPLS